MPQHHKNPSHGPQGLGHQTSKDWGHIKIYMPTHQLSRRIHRGIWQNLQGQSKGTPQGPSPTHHHSHSTGCPVSPECFTTVERESQGVTRNIKEAMYIHVYDPSLIRNLGKFQLPHIWDEALQDTPSLQLK